jgi:hypothetical protein
MYPDAQIVCGEPVMEDDSFDTLTNPSVIIEILSPSTQHVDKVSQDARISPAHISLYMALFQNDSIFCFSENWKILYRMENSSEMISLIRKLIFSL